MKKIIVLIFMIMLLVFSGCTSTISVYGVDEIVVNNGNSEVVVSEGELELDIVLYDSRGYEIYDCDNRVKIYVDNMYMSEHEFKSLGPGTYIVFVVCDSIRSENVRYIVESSNYVDNIYITADKYNIDADNNDYAILRADIENKYGEKIYNKELALYKDGHYYDTFNSDRGYKFYTREEGIHSFYIKCDGLRSSAIDINAEKPYDMQLEKTKRLIGTWLCADMGVDYVLDSLEYSYIDDEYYVAGLSTDSYDTVGGYSEGLYTIFENYPGEAGLMYVFENIGDYIDVELVFFDEYGEVEWTGRVDLVYTSNRKRNFHIEKRDIDIVKKIMQNKKETKLKNKEAIIKSYRKFKNLKH